MSSQDEARILAGALGVDGQPLDEAEDQAKIEADKAVDAILRGRSYLGREFLTWLLWRSNSGDPITEFEGEDLNLLLIGAVVLRGLAEEATELSVKGHLAAYSEVVKSAIDKGLLVHTARLRIQWGEAVYEVSLDAEHLDFKSASIPKLLTEQEDEKLAERLFLCDRLGGMVEALWAAFMAVRASEAWEAEAVPTLKAWLREG